MSWPCFNDLTFQQGLGLRVKGMCPYPTKHYTNSSNHHVVSDSSTTRPSPTRSRAGKNPQYDKHPHSFTMDLKIGKCGIILL